MSQIITPSNAGFSARDLDRRKFQEAVAHTLDRQAKAITMTREFMADLAVRLDALEGELATLKAALTTIPVAAVTE